MDMDYLEKIVTVANIAGHMEHAEKIYADDDTLLTMAAKEIVEAWEAQEGIAAEIGFCEFVEYELNTRFRIE